MFKKSLGYDKILNRNYFIKEVNNYDLNNDKIKHKLNHTLHVVDKQLINNINSVMIYCIKIKNSLSL